MPAFLHPNLFWIGMACVAIPLLIHLLTRQRRQPIQWAAMRFIIEAYKRQRRRLTLEHLLLLAARCLLVALIAFALARPLLQSTSAAARSARVVYILLDNSLASSRTDTDGLTALDAHKKSAAELLASLDAARGDRAGLILLGSPADAVVVPASADISAVRRLVESATPTDSAADLEAAFSRLGAELASARSDSPPVTISLHSEFLVGSLDAERTIAALPTNGPSITLSVSPPRSDAVSNVTIARVEPLRPLILGNAPGGTQGDDQVRVLLRRTGPITSQASTSLVKLRVVTPAASLASADTIAKWSPGDRETNVTLSISTTSLADAGPASLVAEIDRDAIAGDNIFRRPVLARRAIQVALITPPRLALAVTIDRFEPADWLRLALAPQADESSPIRVIDLDPRAVTEPSALAGVDAVIAPRPDLLDGRAWTRLADFSSSGGLVLVAIPPQTRAHAWLDELETAFAVRVAGDREVSRPAEPLTLRAETSAAMLSLLAPELAELAKPVRVLERLRLDAPNDPSRTLLTLSDTSPLLFTPPPAASANSTSPARARRGTLVLLAAAIDLTATDLPARPLMLPLMQELVRQGVGNAASSLASTAGLTAAAPLDAVALSPVPADSGPQVSLSTTPFTPRRAGLWRALDSRGTPISLLAVNADPRAADTNVTTREQVRSHLAAALPDSRISFVDRPSSPGDSAPGTPAAPDDRSPLPAWMLAGAAFCAIVELTLARFFSHARRLSPGLSASMTVRATSRTASSTQEHKAA